MAFNTIKMTIFFFKSLWYSYRIEDVDVIVIVAVVEVVVEVVVMVVSCGACGDGVDVIVIAAVVQVVVEVVVMVVSCGGDCDSNLENCSRSRGTTVAVMDVVVVVTGKDTMIRSARTTLTLILMMIIMKM